MAVKYLESVKGFHPLEEFLSRPIKGSRGAEGYNGAHGVLTQYPSLRSDMVALLEAEGFRRFAFVARGDSALVFDTTRGQLLRIGYTHDDLEPRHRVPQVLQAIDTHSMGPLSLELLPRVPILGELVEQGIVTEARAGSMVRGLSISLAKQGLFFVDSSPFNVGVLPDETPLAVDSGGIRREEFQRRLTADLNRGPFAERGRQFLERFIALKSEPDSEFTWVEDGMWKQHRFYPALATGQPEGVLRDEMLERIFPAKEGMQGALYRAAAERGLYVDDIARAAERATERFLNPSTREKNKDWREMLEREINRIAQDRTRGRTPD